jgi:hypothetical protein
MPTLTLPDGSSVSLTVDELIEYQAKKGTGVTAGSASGRQTAPHGAPSSSTDERWAAFCQLLEEKDKKLQREFVALVKGRAGAQITLEEIAKGMHLANTSKASGTFGGVRRNTTNVGFKADDIITRISSGIVCAGPVLLKKDPPTP